MNLKGWLSRYFRAVLIKHEAQFPCPRCQHPNFYFNMRKRVGYCHHANCHYSPDMDELVAIAGCAPDVSFATSDVPIATEEPDVEITLPEDARQIIHMEDGLLCTDYPRASDQISLRGVVHAAQYRYNIHIGSDRVYIPVYQDGKLVSYVGRAVWWLPYEPFQRYKYPKGTKIANYIFDWDRAKTWTQLTLVENTFNAMWLNRDYTTTNFGSHLSDRQIETIIHGRAGMEGSILLMWDEGADKSAAKAVKKLQQRGIRAGYVKIDGQPDDHARQTLCGYIDRAHREIQKGKRCLTFRTKAH